MLCINCRPSFRWHVYLTLYQGGMGEGLSSGTLRVCGGKMMSSSIRILTPSQSPFLAYFSCLVVIILIIFFLPHHRHHHIIWTPEPKRSSGHWNNIMLVNITCVRATAPTARPYHHIMESKQAGGGGNKFICDSASPLEIASSPI